MQSDSSNSNTSRCELDNSVPVATAADLRNAHRDGDVHPSVYASIAVIAAKLIAGKSVASLYDFALPGDIEIDSLPNAPQLKEVHAQFRDYLPGYATGCSYRYTIDGGSRTLEMTFSDSSFIGHIRGGAAYFIGNVRGDSIYIFDHASSSAINFRISGYRIHEHDNEPNVSSADWLGE